MVITEDFRSRVLDALQEYEFIMVRTLIDRAFCIGKMMEEYGVKDMKDSEAVKAFLSECAQGSSFEHIDYNALSKAIASGASLNFSGSFIKPA